MPEFNPLTYEPGTYPDMPPGTLYQVAYAFAWGYEVRNGQDIGTAAEKAEFADQWARTPHAARPPLAVAHKKWLMEQMLGVRLP